MDSALDNCGLSSDEIADLRADAGVVRGVAVHPDRLEASTITSPVSATTPNERVQRHLQRPTSRRSRPPTATTSTRSIGFNSGRRRSTNAV